MHNFPKLREKWKKGLFLCVGLDTDPEKIPQFLKSKGDIFEAMFSFNKEIIDATGEIVLGYKINSAFYEKYGSSGIGVLKRTAKYIKEKFPDAFLILDAKRGDIGNTNKGYLSFLKDTGFDAMTIHGYLGFEANKVFLDCADKFFFVLSKTSNTGSGEFQDLETSGIPLYLKVAKEVGNKWNKNKNCGLVVGATYPEHIMRVREEAGEEIVILIPGVGAQCGSLKEAIQAGLNSKKEAVIINMSRSVIYSSPGEDFAQAAKKEVQGVNKKIAEYLDLPRISWEQKREEEYKKRTQEILKETRAIIVGGHFVYQAGDHGDTYIAKDFLNPNPLLINEIGIMMADLMRGREIQTVVAPALGGIVLGHVVAKYLSFYSNRRVNSVFVEKVGKDEKGKDSFKVTRGYGEFLKNKKVAVVEDILNSGHSVRKVIECVEKEGAEVKVVCAISNRGGVKPEDISSKAELFSLTQFNFKKYPPKECPLCREGVPINTDFGHGDKRN